MPPFTSSADVSRPSVTTRSVSEPVATGARTEMPSTFPWSSGSTTPIAFAAPVEVGMRLIAAARARRRSLCGKSRMTWSFVYAWIVVMNPDWISPSSWSTFASGATQFVVQDAFETMWCAAGVVGVVVDAEHDRDVGIRRRGGDHDLLRARVEMLLRAFAIGEEAGGLEDDVDAQVAPRQAPPDRARRASALPRPLP